MKVKLSSASKEALVPQDELRFRGTGRSSILVTPSGASRLKRIAPK